MQKPPKYICDVIVTDVTKNKLRQKRTFLSIVLL